MPNKSVLIIDLAQDDESLLVEQVARACSTAGFFQVLNHGISDELVEEFRHQCRRYFTEMPQQMKEAHRRTATNARGYFDDELTKQRLDWKQALDVGVPGSRDWTLPDNDPKNSCLDGFNRLPTEEELSGYRDTIVRYFQACEALSDKITRIMAAGIDKKVANEVVQDLKENHTSYLRMNYYPVYNPEVEEETRKEEKSSKNEPPPLGISPHKDAGYLTVLLQDDDCHSLQVWLDDAWQTVVPVKGAFTINTGDMAQIWSNGLYKAPLHRVLTNNVKERFSAPFFYNPGYNSYMKPVVNASPKYHPCLWGYFRAVRFAGDFTDLGVEIQIEDYETNAENANDEVEQPVSEKSHDAHPNIRRQKIFAEKACMEEPFDVDGFRALLT
uniref:Fe2OG dioxygenase domain-containing protein n=1 Tax=Amphora coffeiformis TaxID=265554 RepID=A0A7S3P576_9STRA|mmetsp:Transcript_9409/g.17976  ORF Transcript_9409/g.17976 Transcript_9409/m.17976 type:complete len:385 (+) Transcript_9409:132-1286(+)|eukprot:scaffold5_cov169-Amphora_coffeaeformis.AAC.16